MSRSRRLGPGVDVLLSRPTDKSAAAEDGELRNIPLRQLRPSPYQPRTQFDEEALNALAESLKSRGTIQPIVVRRVGNQYELVAGERRLRAAQKAELDSLPAMVRDLSDNEAATITLIENLQREDLNPIDEAKALNRLTEQLQCTHEEIADRVGRARATVTNLLRLLRLHADVQKMLADGKLSMGHARVLVPLTASKQQTLAKQIVRDDLSVRDAERLAKNKDRDTGKKPEDPDILRLQQRLSDLIGCPVRVRPRKNGGGQMVIRYSTVQSLQQVLDKLGYRED